MTSSSVKHILMYKLKNLQNIQDIVSIARSIGATPWLVLREDLSISEFPPDLNLVSSLDEAVDKIGRDVNYIVLETYGNIYLTDLPSDVLSRDVCLVVGAEDIGIPEDEAKKLPNCYIVKIPMGIQGISYNVVTSLVMMIEELRLRAMMRVS